MPIDDLAQDHCGLCVAHSLHDVYSSIRSLQHRGREAAGIAFIGDETIDVIKWVGRVDLLDIRDLYKLFPAEKYHTYMAHVRYATRGRKEHVLEDAHPHTIGGQVIHRGNHIIITNCDVVGVHNGQVNPEYLAGINRTQLKTGCDTEVLLQFFRENGERGMLQRIPGSYTMAIASKDRKDVIVLRDGWGIKPGVLGWKDGKHGVASEDIAFKNNGGRFVEDLAPGCVYYLEPKGGYRKERIVTATHAHCFFEHNYIADINSVLDGISVRSVRELLGAALADEFHPKADAVTFLPRCPEMAARSYAEATNIPYHEIFYKPRDERSFLGSTAEERQKSIGSNLFLMPKINDVDARAWLAGKAVVLIDDSTIRGNNSKRAIQLLRDAGVGKVYLANYTPRIGVIGEDNVPRGCLYGVDMPPDDNFVVRAGTRNRTPEEVSEAIGAETYFLSQQGMMQAFAKAGLIDLCTFCIGGKKPF